MPALRAYMICVYNYMSAGVALTGIVSWLTYQAAGGDAIRFAGGQIMGLTPVRAGHLQRTADDHSFALHPRPGVLYELRINKMCAGTAQTLFFVFAGLMGLSLSSIFMAYTGVSIARTFFISAATFGAMSLYGYTTKRDLTGFGSFLFMGLIGLVIAMVVNIFLHSSALALASRSSAC